MSLGVIGTKVGMTQVYVEQGRAGQVTVLKVGACTVIEVPPAERDGYAAVQLGYCDKPLNNAARAERGHVSSSLESKRRKKRQGQDIPRKAYVEPQRVIRDFKLDGGAAPEVGQKLTVDLFKDVKAVDVIGTTKGRGTSGVIKRWGFGGLPAAHGAKKVHREAGSTSSLASNRGSGRPKKGKRLPGRYGNERVTIRNLKVVQVDTENNLLLVRGAVPGFNGAYLMVRPTNKK